MKKTIAVIMALAVVIGLTACGLSKTAEEAKPFKAGVWSVIKDGEEVATYTFTENMKECSYDSAVSGVPFDYELDGDSYIFHLGSVDDNSKAKAVFTDENNCTLIWEEPAREETLKYKGASAETQEQEPASEKKVADPDAPYLIINSEPVIITSKDGFNNAGVTSFLCDATATYVFKSNSDVDWDVFILDEKFEDGARYLSQAHTPMLEGDGVLNIEEGKYIYIKCEENAFTADAPSDAQLEINYAEGLSGIYQDSTSQRATAVVMEEGNTVKIDIHWGNSATDAYTWEMSCTKDGDRLSYSDCEKEHVVTESGEEDDETVYENGEGFFTVKDGKILWDGAAEEECKECVFENIYMA